MRTALNITLCPVFMLTILLSRFPSASWVCTASKAANRLWCTSAAWVGTVFSWTWEKKRPFLTIRLQSPVQCSEVRIVFLLCAYLCNYLDWMSWAILLPSFSLSWGLCIFFSISCIYDPEYRSIISKFCHSFFFNSFSRLFTNTPKSADPNTGLVGLHSRAPSVQEPDYW